MADEASVALHGELTIAAALSQREALLAALAGVAEAGTLRLDLGDIEACDSAGVQLLLALRRSLRERSQGLALAGCAEPVTQALATYGLESLAEGQK